MNEKPQGIKYPPKLDAKKLDFSEFHPLDHSLFQCRDYPGGRKRHWEYLWDLKLLPTLHIKTVCRLGFHHQTTLFQPGKNRMRESCVYCWKPMGEWQPMDQV